MKNITFWKLLEQISNQIQTWIALICILQNLAILVFYQESGQFFFQSFTILVLLLLLLLVLLNKLLVLYQTMVSNIMFMWSVLLLFHEHTISVKLISTMLIAVIIGFLAYKDKLLLVCPQKSIQEFNNKKVIYRFFKWLKVSPSISFLRYFDYWMKRLKVVLPTAVTILLLLITLAVITKAYKIWVIKWILSGIASITLSILGILKFLSEIDEKCFNILIKHDLVCCMIREATKGIYKWVAFTGGAAGVKTYLPETWKSIDNGFAKVFDAVSDEAANSVHKNWNNNNELNQNSLQNVSKKPTDKT